MVSVLLKEDDQKLAGDETQHSQLYHHQDSAGNKTQKFMQHEKERKKEIYSWIRKIDVPELI